MQDTSGWINQRLEVLVRMIQEETLDKGDTNSEIVLTSFFSHPGQKYFSYDQEEGSQWAETWGANNNYY